MTVFAKFEGIDGESKDSNHTGWTDVMSYEWASHKPGEGATGQTRRRGGAVIEDLMMTMEYDKSVPKLLEKMLEGQVIPKLEVESTANYGGARATYLKHVLKNVQVTSCSYTAHRNDETPPTVALSINFEDVKVTYTEYDTQGNKKGNVETTWKVEEGTK